MPKNDTKVTTPSTDKWIAQHWQNIRDCVDDSLQALGSMPVAIAAIEDDPDHIQELLVKLSDYLTALSNHVGENRPTTLDQRHDAAVSEAAE